MASEAKHTPGPWKAKPSPYHDDVFIVQAGMPTNRVLARFGSDDEPVDETDLANAHLIAAAPDMYEALEMVVRGQESAEATGDAEPHPVWEIARAAFAKARGGNSNA